MLPRHLSDGVSGQPKDKPQLIRRIELLRIQDSLSHLCPPFSSDLLDDYGVKRSAIVQSKASAIAESVLVVVFTSSLFSIELMTCLDTPDFSESSVCDMCFSSRLSLTLGLMLSPPSLIVSSISYNFLYCQIRLTVFTK